MVGSIFAASLQVLLLTSCLIASLPNPAHAQNSNQHTPATSESQKPKPKPAQPAKKGSNPASPPVVQARKGGDAKKPPPEKQPHGAQAHGKHPAAKSTTPPAAANPAPEPKPAEPAVPEKPAEPPKGSATGLPLPRFAALRSDEVNMRAGPGTRYPIEWVYKRRDLPVQIEREFEVWRLIRDPEGTKGWVHQATLTGRRSFLVTGGAQMIRKQPDENAAPVAELKPGVVGRIRSCEANTAWCQVQVGEYRGYLKRDQFWGTQPGEVVN